MQNYFGSSFPSEPPWGKPIEEWPLRINAGGPPHEDVYDKKWRQDKYFTEQAGPTGLYYEKKFVSRHISALQKRALCTVRF